MKDAQKSMANAMAERTLQEHVIDAAETYGIRVWHNHDSRRDRAGLPDLLLVGTDVVWAELKSQKGRLRKEQIAFMTDLEQAGQHVLLWRPEHLYDGSIHRTLQRISPRT